MAYTPNNPNGQATMANSAPVVIASDQTSIPIDDNGGSITVDGTVAVSNFPATQPISGTVTVQQAVAANLNATVTGTVNAVQSGTWNLNNISGTISLPTGAATETTLSAINTKIPSGLTVTSTRLLVDGSGVTQPVSGTVTANAGTGNFTVVQATAANLNATITGSVSVSNFPATQPVSGTVAATQSGVWSVGVNNGAGASAVNIQDGGNSITIDGSVSVSNFPATQPVSGTVTANAGTGTFTVGGTVAATQSGVWNVGLNAGTNPIGSITNTSFIATQATAANLNATVVGTGTFAVQAAQSGTWILGANSGVDIGDVTINNAAGAAAVNIQDGGNSITVDGTVSANLNAGTNYVGKVRLTDGTTDAEVVPLTGFNAQAVAIVDGSGNQVTSFGGGTQYADGTAVATPTGTVALGFDGTNVQAITTDVNGYLNTNVLNTVQTNLDSTVQLTGNFLSSPYYGLMVLAQSGSSPVGFQSDGTNLKVISASNPGVNIGDVVVSSGNVAVAGDVAHDSPDAGNPVKIGFQAETAFPTAVANGDRTNGISDRYGRQLVNQIDPGMQVWKSAEYTTTQTGANIWVPTAGRRFVITSLHIATGGTTAGLVTIWGAQTATTAYVAGTDQVFFRGVLTPTANATPGALIQPSHPFFSDTTNDCLKITTSANMTIYIQVNGYEIIP